MAKYDKPLDKDEESGGSAKYRLPFALCKARGIHVPEGATPRDAWDLLKGYNVNPDKEYKRMYDKLAAKKRRDSKKERKRQAHDPEHSPDYKYQSEAGKIAGVSKGKEMTFEQADGMKPNPYYGKRGLYGYDDNCQTCVVAFEARLRGYDVRALPNNRNGYIRDLSHNTNLAYIDQYGKHPQYITTPKGTNKLKFIDSVVREGKRYTVEWAWGNSQEGHIITVMKEKGALKFYDPQDGSIMNEQTFKSQVINRTKKQLKILRVDNCEFDTDFVDHILKGVNK